MRELREVSFPFDRETYDRWIRFERYRSLEGELEALLEETLPLVRPRFLMGEVTAEAVTGDGVRLDGRLFHSAVLAWNLRRTDRAWAYVATCGGEIYRRLREERDPLRNYWIDALAEMAVQKASEALEGRLNEICGEDPAKGPLTCMNPGSADRGVWPLTDQRELFALLGDVEGDLGVRLTEECLMEPSKSLSGIYFRSPEGFLSCWVCSRNPCKTRRGPPRKDFTAGLPDFC